MRKINYNLIIFTFTKEKQGRSLAYLLTGSSAALVIGIPLTRILSDALDWRSIFFILTVVMIGALLYFQKYLSEHSNLKIWMYRFKGVSTKFISNYMS